MNSKTAVSMNDIVQGFSAADPQRIKKTTKADFGVKKLHEAPGEFGKASLCQGGTTWNDQNEQV